MDFALSAINSCPNQSPYIRLLIGWVQMVKVNIQIFGNKLQNYAKKPYWNVVVFWSTIIKMLQYYLLHNVPICILMDFNSFTQSFNDTTSKSNVIQFLLSTFDAFKLDEFERGKKFNVYIDQKPHYIQNQNNPNRTNHETIHFNKQFAEHKNRAIANPQFNKRPNYRPNYNNNRQNSGFNRSMNPTKDKLRLLRRTTHECVTEYGTTCPSDICMFFFGLDLCKNPKNQCEPSPDAYYKHRCAFHPDKSHSFKACETAKSKPNIYKKYVEKFSKIKF